MPCDLAIFHGLDDATARAIAHCESLLMAHHARLDARKREPFYSPAPAGPSRDAAGDFIPLDRAGAGDPINPMEN